MFNIAVALVALLAGSIASIADFGIGSLLTPLVASQYGMKTAVSAIAIPHAIATVLRFWRLRRDVDRRVLLGFGTINASGSLAGALVHVWVNNPILAIVLGILLVFAGIVGVLGYADRMRFRRGAAWLAGGISGAFGGLVGNQGGIRSAAMLGLGVQGPAFVATATWNDGLPARILPVIEKALLEEPPPSPHEIARRLGIRHRATLNK